MWSINPSVYLHRAWDKTNSPYGKVSLVLFYLYIWIGILKCLYGLFDPTMMGMTSCLHGGEDDATFAMMSRGLFLFALAFLVYADKGGLHSWNVGFVTVVSFVWIGIVWNAISSMPEEVYEGCGLGGNMPRAMVALTIAWLLATCIGIVVDEKKADNGTEEERTTLIR